MDKVVKIYYKKEANELKITCSGKEMDVSRIEGFSIEQWLFPFSANGVRWKGLYEELAMFTGDADYILHFDSDEDTFRLVKHAYSGKSNKVVGTNNVVTIVYNENPFTTKITINGKLFDATMIQNRCIDEWIEPICIRDYQWRGIFEELEHEIGTDIYTIYFVGELSFINVLIDKCPANVSIFYRDSKIASLINRAKSVPRVDVGNISESAQKKIDDIQQNLANKDISKKVKGNLLNDSKIKKNFVLVLAVISIVLLFLPFAKFGVSSDLYEIEMTGGGVNANGFETIFGIDEIKVGSNSSIFGFFLLIVPACIIAMNYIKLEILTKKWIRVGVPLIGIIAEIVTLLDIRNLCKTFILEEGVKLDTSLGLGFILILICYIAIAISQGVLSYDFKFPKIKKK